MPRARLTLTIPDGVWIGDVSRAYPDARFRVLAALADERAGVGLAEITETDIGSLLADVYSNEAVTELEPLQRRGDTVLVQFETTTPLLLSPVQSSGIPLEMPFAIQAGEAVWEITAPRDRLSALAEQLDAFGIPFTVDWVQQRIESDRLLTDRQLRLVREATERGYYDTPRTCSLTELATAVGIAKSTCSETLHRAEERIVKRFLEEYDDAVESTERDE
ncbi:helix-turn-helix domain-containing protein [Halegenticoccus tardaugens]|uniref:helix-turn-helix domain-containing protein n=1 Tax=Halegenticoccus tardaugens TaxID=2071624 RepID=UPI00100A9DE6|nr:helix-turn-helix domain-containing protein [Halegenticoccus tardaugens]